MRTLAIIGAGMATAYLLQELALYSHDYRIVVYGEEPLACYNRILLSSVLCGEKQSSDLEMLDPGISSAETISFHSGEKVLGLDTTARTMVTEKHHSVHWDLLVLATGSRAAIPAVDNTCAANVHVFRSLQDLDHIIASAGEGRRAVVIGGGLLGLEAAVGLNGMGVTTTVINRQGHIMNRQLDERAAGLLQGCLERKGIQFVLGASPVSLQEKADRVHAVTLSTGESLPCDLVVIATGITPNREVAESAGIACDRAILVDDTLRTSAAGVFALGECCEWRGHTFGLVAPIRDQAAVLAYNLCHDDHRTYHYEENPVHLKISGVHVVSAGSYPYPDGSQSQIVIDTEAGIYRRLVFRNEQLIGFQLVGDKSHNAWYSDLLHRHSNVTDIRPRMMFSPDESPPVSRVA